MKGITILGATGSIGLNTLSVLADHLDKFGIVALTANTNVKEMLHQCERFHPDYAVMQDANAAENLRTQLKNIDANIQVLSGQQGLKKVACLEEIDYVMAAIVGAAGLLPTLAAVKKNKRVLLANKESLVMAGNLFMAEAKAQNSLLIPVDSEHSAIFQCLPESYIPGNRYPMLQSIYLTASGGPFRNFTFDQLTAVTPQQACAHPTWNMGRKISVDSATMMNKGFEVIEACWLFGLMPDEINVLLHPQSIVHSFIEFKDGSILAQLGDPDMRIPISYALAWPERMVTHTKRLQFHNLKQLDFDPISLTQFPCLALAYQAMKRGGTCPTILNAANEVAVHAFLQGHITFLDIYTVVEKVLSDMTSQEANSLQTILEEDAKSREMAGRYIAEFSKYAPLPEKIFDRKDISVENIELSIP